MYESYLWSTGDTTRSISIRQEGWYWCEVPNLYGDIMRDSVYVYDLVGRANLKDTAICLGDTVIITLPLSLNPTRPYAAGNLPPFTPQASYTYQWKNSNGQIVSTDSILKIPLQDTYSLKITDTLGCFITDTVQVLVDSFEVQASLGPDTSLCSGDKIGLVTAQAQADSFLWSTGSTDSLLVVNTAGTYSLIVHDTLGCTAKDTITVAIHGITPYVVFSADTVCFRDSTLFIDSSHSLDQSNLILWNWEFGDNSPPLSVSSSLSLPHLYPDSGNYIAKLTVSTDSNCSNYAYRNVYVRPLPEPDFYPLTGCQNLEITFDNLTLHKDSLVAFFWNFGNGDTALQSLTPQAPYAAGNLPSITYIYSQSGQFNTSLTATDIYGCKDSIIKQVDIKPSPSADFSYSSVCNGSPVSFADQSQTLPYNPIMTYEWNFDPFSPSPNPPVSTSPSPKYTFSASGYYPTALRVIALNACWDTITLPVKVNAIPQAGFSWQNACSTSPIQFMDTSVVSLDSINSWYWNFDHGTFLSTVEAPIITINDTLIHHATLRVKSSAGCEDSTAHTFKVYPSPTAAFTMDREYGLPPLTVNFDNQSITGSKQQTLNNEWQFGDGFYSNQENPSHIYTDSNIFHPQLIVENTYGCKDSVLHTVYVVYAAVDIAVTDVVSSQDQGYARFSCVIENRGQQKIKAIDLTANYNGGQPIQEQWTGELFASQKINYVFQAKIKLSGTPSYYCITATPLNTDIEDESPANNTLCKEYQAQLWVGNTYPNPTSDFINIDVILPVNQEISLSVSNIEGKQLQSVNIKANRGLNQLKINTTSYPAGTYQLKIESGTDSEVRRFIIL
ncbi:MAG: hypothetical protein DSY76_06285 [Bacteroidetes bacterium]|nr:MAG: hypothetical protein DSY76_06285 [Bacteroidota bacterium]